MSWQISIELANQRIEELCREADRARMARVARRSQSRRSRSRMRRLLRRPIGAAGWVNTVVGVIIGPPWHATNGSRVSR
jgi:hypothetical protein